jgi:hypothetical protein
VDATTVSPSAATPDSLDRGAAVVKLLGLDVRMGMHTGEVEPEGEGFIGITVHIGACVMQMAGPGEVLVLSTVKGLVAGSSITFMDRGTHPRCRMALPRGSSSPEERQALMWPSGGNYSVTGTYGAISTVSPTVARTSIVPGSTGVCTGGAAARARMPSA